MRVITNAKPNTRSFIGGRIFLSVLLCPHFQSIIVFYFQPSYAASDRPDSRGAYSHHGHSHLRRGQSFGAGDSRPPFQFSESGYRAQTPTHFISGQVKTQSFGNYMPSLSTIYSKTKTDNRKFCECSNEMMGKVVNFPIRLKVPFSKIDLYISATLFCLSSK